jgi:putative heme transporter
VTSTAGTDETVIVTDESDGTARPDQKTESGNGSGEGRTSLVASAPKIGVWAWSFVGIVVAAIIVFTALGAVSEIALPLLFAAVLAIIFKPLVGILVRHKFRPTLAAGLVVLGLIALMTLVVVATVRGVSEQTDQIGASVDAAIHKVVDTLDVNEASLNDAKAATKDAASMITGGVLNALVSGVGSLIGLVGGLILGALIMYYLLKDGSRFSRRVVGQFDPAIRDDVGSFIADSCRILRDYGQGRTVMSAIVAVVIALAALLLGLPLVFSIAMVNFIGGYIPYIGAFLGGGLA